MIVPDVAGPFDRQLTGSVAIVTGAGAHGDGIGNGRAAALLLARMGATVLAIDRKMDAAERTVEMIASEGGTARACAADVSAEPDCERAVNVALAEFGRIDLLDNNVGIGSRGSVVKEDTATWDKVMSVNVRSMFLMSKYAIPAIAASGGGAIVNVSSIATLMPRGLTAYSTSKGAVIALTKAMAVDHAAQGIRVNCVAPGPVFTPMVDRGNMSPEQREKRKQASLLGIEGTGWDVGHAVAFLLSNAARYITGQTLVVDGGTTLQGPAR